MEIIEIYFTKPIYAHIQKHYVVRVELVIAH